MAYDQREYGDIPRRWVKIRFWPKRPCILGDVTMGRDCSIWYNAVLRGDVNKIVIGDRTNIQDGVVLHTIYDKAETPVADHHRQRRVGGPQRHRPRRRHRRQLPDRYGRHPAGQCRRPLRAASSRPTRWCCRTRKLEPNSVYAGIPAKKVKEITPEQRDEIVLRTARDYQLYASWFKEE